MSIRKRLAAGVTAVLLGVTLASCGTDGGTTPSDGATPDGSTAGGGDVTEVHMVIFGGGGADTFNNAAAEFNSRNADIKLVIEPATGDYNQFLGARTAAGDLPDMFWLTPYSQVQQFAASGQLMDLSDQPFVEKVYPSSLDSVTLDDAVYAYPLRQEFLGIFYNTELFAQAGIEAVPTTLSEFREVCEKLDAAGITPFAATFKDDWTLNHAFSVVQAAAIGDDYSTWLTSMNDGSGTFAAPGTDDGFAFLDLMKQYSGSNFLDADSTAGFTKFAEGKAAMLFSGEFSLLNIPDINPDLPVDLFAAPITEDPNDARLNVDIGVTVAINKDTPNAEAALRVLDFMSDDTDQEGWFAATNNAMGEAVPAMPWEGTYTADYMDSYREYMESEMIKPWVYQQLPAGMNSEIGKIIQSYFAGTMTQEQVIPALDAANAELAK